VTDQPFRGYEFADFRLELAKRRLSGPADVPIPLSARAYDVLAYLVAHRDRVVGKDELLKAVWPQTVVEDNNLNQAISAARRALGDSRDSPRFIVTVPGRGYQFVGDVAPLPEPSPQPREAASLPNSSDRAAKPPRVSRRTMLAGVATATLAVGGGIWWNEATQPSRRPKSIAVLPFKPLLQDKRNAALELGVTELLTNRLSGVPGISVLPLSSVMRFAAAHSDPLEAGRQLGVDAIVEGHVYIHDDQVRLTARLVAIEGNTSLWANSYTERMGELLAVQDSLAMQLANALSTELSADTRSRVVSHVTSDAEAWQLYANGRYLLDRRDASSLRRAIEFFETALRRDARFALASAGLSDAHTLTSVFNIAPQVSAYAEARKAALRALDLDPRLPAAHLALGHVLTNYDRDLKGGRRYYLEALKLQPEFARAMGQMALNLVQAGDLAGATDYIGKARALEPASLPFMALSGWIRYFTRAFDEAEKTLSQVVDLVPEAAIAWQFLAHVLLAKREGARVVEMLERRNDPAPTSPSNLGRAYAQTKNVAAARREIDRLEAMTSTGYGVGFDVALIHLELGDRARALDGIERGMTDYSNLQCYITVEPALDPLRSEARFAAVTRRLGLA
jgi:DNA-binding winged helix-turn-helix (wHTH) protein/TolB-like protein/Flp pilus assembly protein TadD